MIERTRAELDGKIVTVLSATSNAKNADVEIRDEFGYTSTVKAHRLKKLDANDNRRTFKAPQV